MLLAWQSIYQEHRFILAPGSGGSKSKPHDAGIAPDFSPTDIVGILVGAVYQAESPAAAAALPTLLTADGP